MRKSGRPKWGSPDNLESLSLEDRERLRDVALRSIQHGLEEGKAFEPELAASGLGLTTPGATFVTLEIEGNLRGCIGTFEARHPLIVDVAKNAFAAAFLDHRFSPITPKEVSRLDLHISLLGPLRPLEARDRQDLLDQLRPGVDGLLLEDLPHRSTFLPQVWESLQEPADFLEELLRKAGLSRNHWSNTIRFFRYEVEEI